MERKSEKKPVAALEVVAPNGRVIDSYAVHSLVLRDQATDKVVYENPTGAAEAMESKSVDEQRGPAGVTFTV